jgi:hypothetical protein
MRMYLTWLVGMTAIAAAVHLGPRHERIVERVVDKPSFSGTIRIEQSFDSGQTWENAAYVEGGNGEVGPPGWLAPSLRFRVATMPSSQ